MSRIGKMPVVLADKVEAKILDNVIEVKGSLGTLRTEIHELVSVSIENNNVIVIPKDLENPLSKALWGTTRANINNMVQGVSKGYTKSLEISGVGYKMEIAGNKLVLSIGFSHKVDVLLPSDVTMKADEKLKNTIHFSSINKQLLGEFVAKIRSLKKPEPYKGKGIKYVGENIRRKAGKSGK
ncbi:MAG: 50S ribosomal protein L6 [Candidatus Gracilibacteria bacterium]|nr:50S ribosomal protein L6 [Candidatus Gracilibacteria bacterium]